MLEKIKKMFESGAISVRDMVGFAVKLVTDKNVAAVVAPLTQWANELQQQHGKKYVLVAETDPFGHIILTTYHRNETGGLELLAAGNLSNLNATPIKALLNGIVTATEQQPAQ